ncbi:MAG: hypothetical protein ACHQ1F_01630 [Spirochaetia bacterium]
MKSTIGALCCAVAVLLAGCSTLPGVQDPSGVDVSVIGLTDQKVMMYYGQGDTSQPDPYLPSGQLLVTSSNPFVVLRIGIASIRNAFVTLDDAEAKDSSGTVVARLSSKKDFLDLLGRQSTDEQLLAQLGVKVERTYFPGGGLRMDPGNRSFAVVLMGKTQFPTPLTVTAQLSVEGTARVFQFQWPN